MRFYLGTHRESWLALTDVPLFISRRRLAKRKTLPRARGTWALDSGGFTELSLFGGWQTQPQQYINEVRRFRDEIGGLQWAAPQDWMCEPWLLKQTRLTVHEHQDRTIANFLILREAAPDLPFIPVLQGWESIDYLKHVEMYDAAGVALDGLVGLGSVCRRQNMQETQNLVQALAVTGLRLHGFGFKLTGLRAVAHHLHSADSLAWSYSARRQPAIRGHTHKNCANCWEYALAWRERVLKAIEVPKQLALVGDGGLVR